MGTKQINHDYFFWLVDKIRVPSGRTCGDMFEEMHNTEFVWTVPNDDNRVQDGVDLRREFVGDRSSVLALEIVTFLEVLVGLSRRLEFTAGGNAEIWAWQLIRNLRLQKMIDPLGPAKRERVRDILDTVIWRTYREDGRGGFFPLSNPTDDQTKVEIWYQMNAYVIEMKSV